MLTACGQGPILPGQAVAPPEAGTVSTPTLTPRIMEVGIWEKEKTKVCECAVNEWNGVIVV